jgi:ATP-dependent helicase/nuclease subunit A
VGAMPSPEAAGTDDPAVELLLTAREGWDAEGIDLQPAIDSATPLNCLAEARFLAARLRALAEAGVPRGEMVVLLRAFTHLDAYEDSLERAGLAPYVVGGRGYWSQQQVADVCALLATIANPLEDQALFGALASPACGAAPDTLWLLRTAAGSGRHVWPALERALGRGGAELAEPERLTEIPESELLALTEFVGQIESLRERQGRLGLAGLIEAAMTETGYDLAVLMRPAGEARFANVRKLISLVAAYESREGHDLRGLLEFLGDRAASDSDAQAATAAEGHDGVRIMTVHNAKGLEFEVVAVPDLSRSLLAGTRAPLLALGREEPPRAGMQLRRLGSSSINLYDYTELCEEGRRHDSEEGLRLFHVAATRARRRLLLSGVVKPEPGREIRPGTPIVERLVEALDAPRDADAELAVAPPQPRAGLEASFAASRLLVRTNRPSRERATELTVRSREATAERALGEGPPPLVERRPPIVPARPLSYTAIAAYEECPYRFYMERVLGLGRPDRGDRGVASSRYAEQSYAAREERTARGAAVHALLEWSRANEWREPTAELTARQAIAEGLDEIDPEELLEPIRGWLGSELRKEIDPASARAEVPILLGINGSVLRGSIDLLVQRSGAPALVVDYKTDRLEVQRAIYALAVAEATNAEQVEVAYVFLERPAEPVIARVGPEDLVKAQVLLEERIERIGAGEFPVAKPQSRSWSLCRGCPALGRLCSGPVELRG